MLSIFPGMFTYLLVAPFLLRIILALIFIGNGYSKMFKGRDKTLEFFNSISLKPAEFWVYFIGIIELVSGFLFLLGFLVQAAAIAVSLVMLGSILRVKIKQGFLGGYDFDLLILACAVSLLFLGPGIFSIDLPL